MNIWGKVTGKRRAFLSLLCDGIPPYDACRKIWPKLKDVHGHVANIFSDSHFKEVYARLTEYKNNREIILADCRRVIESEHSKPSDQLSAIKVIGMIKGYISVGRKPDPKAKPVPIEDEVLVRKMAELGQKAYDKDRKAN